MKTIRIEKIDAGVPSPDGNPVSLCSTGDHNLGFGDIRHVKTGIRFYLPANTHCYYEPLVQGIVVLGTTQGVVEGDLQLVILCCVMQARIGTMQPVAKMVMFESKPMLVRFAEFSEGKRLVFGGGEGAVRVDNPDTKS